MVGRGISSITMKTNAAVGLLVTGLSLVLLATRNMPALKVRAARSLALIAFLIGFFTVCENITGWDLHIDQLIATEPAGALATHRANQMGFPASTSLLFAGISLLLSAAGIAEAPQLHVACPARLSLSAVGFDWVPVRSAELLRNCPLDRHRVANRGHTAGFRPGPFVCTPGGRTDGTDDRRRPRRSSTPPMAADVASPRGSRVAAT